METMYCFFWLLYMTDKDVQIETFVVKLSNDHKQM